MHLFKKGKEMWYVQMLFLVLLNIVLNFVLRIDCRMVASFLMLFFSYIAALKFAQCPTNSK